MGSAERVIPLWVQRAIAFVLVAVCGATVAMACAFFLPSIGVGGDYAFAVLIARYEAVVAAAIVGGILLGVAAISGRGRALDPRRVLVAAVALAGFGVAGLLAPALVAASWEFEAAAFREARAAGDDDELERQANLAVEHEALIGRSRSDVRTLLGRPDRTGRRRRLWVYDVGFINDFLGPGDGGYLFVRFDEDLRRAVDAKVGTSY